MRGYRLAAICLLTGSGAALIAGCSTNSSEPSAPASSAPETSASASASASEESATRLAAGVKTCPDLFGPKDAPSYIDVSTRYTIPITFVNNSTRGLTLNTSQIDCYDFSGTENPSAFDGATIAAGASSGPYNMIARRTCAYIPGDIIGKFQEREAHWKTTVTDAAYPVITGSIPTTIECSSFGQSPTMCRSGPGQRMASYTVNMTRSTPLRASYTCHGTDVTVTFSDLY